MKNLNKTWAKYEEEFLQEKIDLHPLIQNSFKASSNWEYAKWDSKEILFHTHWLGNI